MSADAAPNLRSLHEACERISATLVELELDSGRQLLEASSLEGGSADRWAAASQALTELWRRHGLLESLLARADEAAAARRSDELRRLLEGPSVELAGTDLPVAERSLLGDARNGQRCTPAELLRAMSAQFDAVTDTLAAIAGRWDTLTPSLDEARRQLNGARALAQECQEPAHPALEALAVKVDRLSRVLARDPLSVDAGEVEGLLDGLRSLASELERDTALRRGFDVRMFEARSLLDRLRDTVAACEDARAELEIKISVPAGAAAPPAVEALERELTHIAELARAGSWREARRALDAWAQRADAQMIQTERALAANRAPIEARNQFRALLDAYQVKAARLGLLEEAEFEQLFVQAREELYRAPTDLGRAAQLVRAYQQAVNGPASPEGLR